MLTAVGARTHFLTSQSDDAWHKDPQTQGHHDRTTQKHKTLKGVLNLDRVPFQKQVRDEHCATKAEPL